MLRRKDGRDWVDKPNYRDYAAWLEIKIYKLAMEIVKGEGWGNGDFKNLRKQLRSSYEGFITPDKLSESFISKEGKYNDE